MNKKICLLLFFDLIFQVLTVIPEWNLTSAGKDLLGSNEEEIIEIYNRNLYNVIMVFKKKFKKTEDGIIVTNIIKIGNIEKEVNFEQVESYYYLYNKYIVCPKGRYHPYIIKESGENEELKPSDFCGENWDLRCFKHTGSGYFVLFYLMNGGNANIYLTKDGKSWKGEASNSIDNAGIKNTYDFLLKSDLNSGYSDYQMLALLEDNNYLKFNYLAFLLEGTDAVKSYKSIEIIKKEKYTQATFKNSSESYKYFYYFTYNDISDFKTGYSISAIDKDGDYYSIPDNNFNWRTNAAPHLEFLDDMNIKKMNFLLNNKFLYYQMESKNNSDIYHGIFDIKLNKIIFNTKEEIIEFLPFSDNSMYAITKEKAYKICAYNNNNDCTDTCYTNKYTLDIDGNTCDDSCKDNKYVFVPSGVCINECDEAYYTKIESNRTCGLCRDIGNNHPYKFIGGTKCLNEIPPNAYVYNEKLMLLNCSEGYHIENDSCVRCYPLCLNCSKYSSDPNNQSCDSCLYDFLIYDNHNCRCQEGYQLNGTNCEQCDTQNNCETYKINSCDCKTCNEGYYLNDYSKCEPCDSNCKSCSINATNCIGCEGNYFLEENHCYQCTECNETDSQTCKCQSCKDGFYLDFFQCKQCENNCKTCENADKCLSCVQFYKLENSQCVKCPSDIKCETTLDNSCNCASCNSSYFLHNGECINCIDQTQCKTYKEDNCQCQECKEGLYLEDYQCKQCNSDCKTCENENKCLSCDQFYKLENSQCVKCPSDIKCKTTLDNSCNCASCNSSYFLHDDKCFDCIDQSQCKTYKKDNCECQECKEKFYLENYQCKQCKSDCKTCENENGCSSCEQFYQLENSQCVKCPSDIKCKTTLDNSCKCASCNQSYYFDNNECFDCIDQTQCITYEEDNCKCKECKEGFYKEKYSCKKCNDICLTCDGGFDNNLDYHCLSCKKDSEYPYLFIDDKRHICVKNCSEYNATANIEKNICEFPTDGTTEEEQGGNGDGEADYMLWIFVSIIGILLILVSVCICKRFICRKTSDDIELIDEMGGELTEK